MLTKGVACVEIYRSWYSIKHRTLCNALLVFTIITGLWQEKRASLNLSFLTRKMGTILVLVHDGTHFKLPVYNERAQSRLSVVVEMVNFTS